MSMRLRLFEQADPLDCESEQKRVRRTAELIALAVYLMYRVKCKPHYILFSHNFSSIVQARGQDNA